MPSSASRRIKAEGCERLASRDMLRIYEKSNPRIRIVEHERNQGLMLTRRDGCQAATGDCVMFLDADDELPLDAVQRLIEARGEADIVCGNILKIQHGTLQHLAGIRHAMPSKTF